jgi:DNA-binding LacI/PurR family transcriptional regulator
MIRKKVSLQDLANTLNLSVSTVSRSLKDHPDISAEVKIKVHDLAKKLNYIPAEKVADFKTKATRTIGVIVPNIERSFYAAIISGIENFAKQEGYFIVLANSRESYQNEVDCIDNLIKLKVDGLVVSLSQETQNYDHFNKAMKANIPLVFFDRVCRCREFSSVVADNADAAKNITDHLLATGRRNVAHIAGPKSLSITKERIAGYFKSLEENKLIFNDQYLVYCDLSPVGAQKAIEKLLNVNPVPDAIFCVNDTVAFVAMKEIRKRGYRVPEDIALTGFNNEFHSTIIEPELTTIAHPTFEMGQETARLLIGQLDSNTQHAPRQIVMRTNLVVRGSSQIQ